jgi:4-oxalocrotonate tautomerase
MPYVNVRITRDGVTREQKAEVNAEMTETLRRVLGKSPDGADLKLSEALTSQGHRVGAWTVGNLLKEAGYSLQSNCKT